MGVQSIERAFTLLRVIAEHQDGISVTDLARQANLHKSTVSRLVMSLETEQAVARDNGYLFIGDGIAALLAPSIYPPTLKSLARPFLHHLTDTTHAKPRGFVSQMVTMRTSSIRYWRSRLSKFRIGQGGASPCIRSHQGSSSLPMRGGHALKSIWRKKSWCAMPQNTIIEPATLRVRLGTIRTQGYDWAFEEFSDGLAVVSAPVFDSEDTVIASIYVCGPRFRFPPEGKQDEITQLVVGTGVQLTDIIRQNR